jgi:hypothetical protein
MSYELLLGLYFGESSNADLTSPAARRLLHVRTPLEDYVASAVASGLDVVLTGNPGDGKSHVMHVLRDGNTLKDVEVCPDLSAGPSAAAVGRWLAARDGGKRFLLLGNEGPLIEFVAALDGEPRLAAERAELSAQLRRLLVQRVADLPSEPKRVALVDLADRNVLDVGVIESMLARVSSEEFLPTFPRAVESSVGRNLVALQHREVRARLARLLCAAGRRRAEHVTFRQLWAAIAYAITAGKAESTLRQEMSRDDGGLGATLLGNLSNARGGGPLLAAIREFADVASVSDPELDDQLWSTGQPGAGEWYADEFHAEPPALQWASGERNEALLTFGSLKRATAVLHERGSRLVEGAERMLRLPRESSDPVLRRAVVHGLRHLYLSPSEAGEAPDWLLEGIPLWVGFSYSDTPNEDRPHVAVRCIAEADFEVLRPVRAPWLDAVLGPAPDIVWFVHCASGISMPVGPELLGALVAASRSSGPMRVPEPAQRFLVRLAGWDESAEELEPRQYPCAVLDRPRGRLEVTARIERTGHGARYV